MKASARFWSANEQFPYSRRSVRRGFVRQADLAPPLPRVAEAINDEPCKFAHICHTANDDGRGLRCRHANPHICAKSAMVSVCALVRADGMCLSAPKNWSKRYRRLAEFPDDKK